MVIKIDLNGPGNLECRTRVNKIVEDQWEHYLSKFKKPRNQTVDSKKLEVKKGFLAEYVIREQLGLKPFDPDNSDYSADMVSPHGLKIDIKTEGVKFDFQEEYVGSGQISRQAKHNFYPRQLYDPNLMTTDLFLVTRLRTGDTFPGTGRPTEKRWSLWICGWVSKKRVIKEGVLIPRGGITEQGSKFFDYRSHNVEFYQFALNKIVDLKKWFETIDQKAVREDESRDPDDTQQCTNADAQRISSDLLSKNIITRKQFDAINQYLGLSDSHVPSILDNNLTIRFIRYLIKRGVLESGVVEKLPAYGIVETGPEDLDELRRFFVDGGRRRAQGGAHA